LLDSDFHRWVEERGCLGSRVADKDIELTEFGFNFGEHLPDLFGIQHIGLNHETIGASLAHLCKRVGGSTLVLIVVNGSIDAVIGQLQRDSATNAT
jgi:hypothetical protein